MLVCVCVFIWVTDWSLEGHSASTVNLKGKTQAFISLCILVPKNFSSESEAQTFFFYNPALLVLPSTGGYGGKTRGAHVEP